MPKVPDFLVSSIPQSVLSFRAGGGGNVELPIEITDVNNLQSELSGKADIIHTHAIADVSGLQTALDNKSNVGHTHAIADVSGLQTALDNKSNVGHTHAINDVSGLQTELDEKALKADNLPFSDWQSLEFETTVTEDTTDPNPINHFRVVEVQPTVQTGRQFLASIDNRPTFRAIQKADLPADTLPKQILFAQEKAIPEGFSLQNIIIGNYEDIDTFSPGGRFGGMVARTIPNYSTYIGGFSTGGSGVYEPAEEILFIGADVNNISSNQIRSYLTNIFFGRVFVKYNVRANYAVPTNAIIPKSTNPVAQVFIIGGRDAGGTPVTTVTELTNFYTITTRASLPAARDNAGGCILGDYIYIFASVPNTAVLRYNINTNTWETLGINTPNTGATYNCVSAVPISENECYVLFSVEQKNAVSYSESGYVGIYKFNANTNTFTRLAQEGGGIGVGTEFSFSNCNAAEYVGGVLMVALRKLPATSVITGGTVNNYAEYLIWTYNEYAGTNNYIPAWYDSSAIGGNEQGSALFWHRGYLYECFGTRNSGIPITKIMRRKFDILLEN